MNVAWLKEAGGSVTMSSRLLVVGIEDLGTAGVVAAYAAHLAAEQGATNVLLLHVLDDHCMLSGMYALAMPATSMAETAEEGGHVLVMAEAALRAEFAAMKQPLPEIVCKVVGGPPGTALAACAAQPEVIGIVLGARRPHAFGRLTHPDVRSHVRHHGSASIFVAPLQAPADEQEEVPKT
jgi:nucleotide-binding universal stress UspA family protein